MNAIVSNVGPVVSKAIAEGEAGAKGWIISPLSMITNLSMLSHGMDEAALGEFKKIFNEDFSNAGLRLDSSVEQITEFMKHKLTK